MPRVIVVGCGVAGPAIASFLQQIGWEVEIHEAAPKPDPYGGAFLSVSANGLAVLDDLGLAERLRSDAHACPTMVMWSASGKKLAEVPNGPAGDPQRGSVIVRRGWLHDVLRSGAESRGIPIRYGARLDAIEEVGSGVVARFADGTLRDADVLIGCEGIGSPTRRHIDPAAPQPTSTGLVGLGGYARVPGLAPTTGTQHMVFGRRSFFGYLVRDDGTTYWFANVTAPVADRGSVRAVPSEQWLGQLRELHADDPDPVPQILEHTTSELRGYRIDDLSSVPRWSRGRVVAIGDAVHATSPSSGQGSAMALEDAVTLATCLRRETGPDGIDRAGCDRAFGRFQSLRADRVDRVVSYGRQIDSRKRIPGNRVTLALRDALLPVFLRKAASDHTNNWVYDFESPWQA